MRYSIKKKIIVLSRYYKQNWIVSGQYFFMDIEWKMAWFLVEIEYF